MVLAEHGTVRVVVLRCDQAKGTAREGVVRVIQEIRNIDHCRRQIDEARPGAHALPLGHARASGNHGDAGRCLIHDLFRPEAVIAHHVAMIGCVDDRRVVRLPRLVQRREDSSHAVVHKGHESIVCGPGLPHPSSIEVPVVIEESGNVLQLGMPGSQRMLICDRKIDGLRVVEVVEFRRRDERIMRADEGHERHPWEFPTFRTRAASRMRPL